MATLGDCWRQYLPLGLTFLLMAGVAPVVDIGVRWGQDVLVADRALAAFTIAMTLTLVVHSPLFCTREIVMTVVRDRHSLQRATFFVAGVAAVLTVVDLFLALSPIGDQIVRWMTQDHSIVPAAKRSILALSIMPALITVRSMGQGLLIANDRSIRVGFCTVGRLVTMAGALMFGFRVAPDGGAVVGSLAFGFSVSVEALLIHFTARRERAHLCSVGGTGQAPRDDESIGGFALPLMFGNMVGLVALPVLVAVAGHTLAETANASTSAFRLISTLSITVGSPLFAMQALATAKSDSSTSRSVLVRFTSIVAVSGSLLLAVVTFTAPLRDLLMTYLLNAPPGSLVYKYALSAIPLAVFFPLGVAAKATLRGILIRNRLTGRLLVATVAAVGPPVVVYVLAVCSAPTENRASQAYWGWLLAVVAEAVVLVYFALRSPRRSDAAAQLGG